MCRRRADPERDDGDYHVFAGRVPDPVGNRHPVHDLLRQAPCPRRGGDHGGGDADDRAAAAGRLHGAAEHHHRFRGGPDRIGARPVERLPGGHPLCRRQPGPRRRHRAGHPGARPAPCAGHLAIDSQRVSRVCRRSRAAGPVAVSLASGGDVQERATGRESDVDGTVVARPLPPRLERADRAGCVRGRGVLSSDCLPVLFLLRRWSGGGAPERLHRGTEPVSAGPR